MNAPATYQRHNSMTGKNETTCTLCHKERLSMKNAPPAGMVTLRTFCNCMNEVTLLPQPIPATARCPHCQSDAHRTTEQPYSATLRFDGTTYQAERQTYHCGFCYADHCRYYEPRTNEAIAELLTWMEAQFDVCDNDGAIIREAIVAAWKHGNPVDLETARMIAYRWHGGGGSPLYEWASTGTTTRPEALKAEVAECVEGEEDRDNVRELLALFDYLSVILDK